MSDEKSIETKIPYSVFLVIEKVDGAEKVKCACISEKAAHQILAKSGIYTRDDRKKNNIYIKDAVLILEEPE